MMINSRRHTMRFLVQVLLGIGLLLPTFAEAGWVNPFVWLKNRNQKRIDTLIVTGNYVQSRVLAELIQYHIRQPVLLLPSGDETETMYFLGPKMQAMEVPAADFLNFVHFLDPRKILFLGDKRFTPPEFNEKVQDRRATWVVNSSDWEQNAKSIERTLHIRKLTFDYLVLLKQLEDKENPQPAVLISPASGETQSIFGNYKTKGRYWTPSKRYE